MTRAAFTGKHCTHVKSRGDALIHQGREYVPTIYGEKSGNMVWIDSLEQLKAVGGNIGWNEDHTEIWLTLPEGHKFSCNMFEGI